MTWYEVVFDRRRLLVNEDYIPLQKEEKSCWEILVSADCVLAAVSCFVWCGQKQFGTDRKIDEVIRRIRVVATQLRELNQSRNLSRDRTLESHRMVWLKRKVMVTVAVRSLLWEEEEEEEREELFFFEVFYSFFIRWQTDRHRGHEWLEKNTIFYWRKKSNLLKNEVWRGVVGIFVPNLWRQKGSHSPFPNKYSICLECLLAVTRKALYRKNKKIEVGNHSRIFVRTRQPSTYKIRFEI